MVGPGTPVTMGYRDGKWNIVPSSTALTTRPDIMSNSHTIVNITPRFVLCSYDPTPFVFQVTNASGDAMERITLKLWNQTMAPEGDPLVQEIPATRQAKEGQGDDVWSFGMLILSCMFHPCLNMN